MLSGELTSARYVRCIVAVNKPWNLSFNILNTEYRLETEATL